MTARRFKPALVPFLATLVVIAVCVRAGIWQLDRAETRETLASEREARNAQGPRQITELLEMKEPGNYPVQVRGHFDNQHNILLDNRTLNGVAGYHLLTPLETQAGIHVLVNRGWLPRGPDRARLPDIAPIDGLVTVHGQSYVYSDRIMVLAEDDLSSPEWPLRLQRVEMQAIGQVLGVELAPFELRVDPGQALEQSGPPLPRVWQDATMTADRHRAYAVQWFGLAAAVLVIFLAASFRPNKQDPHLNA